MSHAWKANHMKMDIIMYGDAYSLIHWEMGMGGWARETISMVPLVASVLAHRHDQQTYNNIIFSTAINKNIHLISAWYLVFVLFSAAKTN